MKNKYALQINMMYSIYVTYYQKTAEYFATNNKHTPSNILEIISKKPKPNEILHNIANNPNSNQKTLINIIQKHIIPNRAILDKIAKHENINEEVATILLTEAFCDRITLSHLLDNKNIKFNKNIVKKIKKKFATKYN